MAVGSGGRKLMGPLLMENLVVSAILLGLAGWSLDKYIDGHQNHPQLGGNPSTIFLLIFALIAGTMGLCSVFLGFVHVQLWNAVGLANAVASAVISFGTIALAFGLVCKQIIMGGHRGNRLRTLEAFIALSVLSQLLYLFLLYASMFSSQYGPAYNS